MEDASLSYPISCENCRNKKSKCDRELPICSQCASSNVECRYPPVNKRGIPSGYLSFIEQRLLDTELVVFELLSSIYKSQNPIQPQRLSEIERQTLAATSQKQSKSSKIAEWTKMPLATDENRHEWWIQKCETMSLPTQPGSNHVMTPQDTWADASPMSVQYEDTQTQIAMQSPFPVPPQQPAPVALWQQPSSIAEPSTDGRSDDRASPTTYSTLPEGPSDNASETALNSLSASNNSNRNQSRDADRWRKYF